MSTSSALMRTSSALAFLFIAGTLVFGGCSSSSDDSSSNVTPSVYISSPNSAGRVVITGTQNVVPGEGAIVGKNLTKSSAALLADEGCVQDTAVALEDGSFFNLSLCAEIGDAIGLTYKDGDGDPIEIGTYAVPVATASTCATGERAFKISNTSKEDVWLGVTAGTISCLSDSDCPTAAVGSCTGANPGASVAGTCGCSKSTSDCGTISQCSKSNSLCYWNLPPLSIGQMHLTATTGESILCFPAPQTGVGIQWSGNMFARTGCDEYGQNCATGDCKSAKNGACPTGTGGVPPATLLEFTLSNQAGTSFNPDFYDVSIINGINVAASFAPSPGTFAATANDPYSCMVPGSTAKQGKLSACSWEVTPVVDGIDRTYLLRDIAGTFHDDSDPCPTGSVKNTLGYCECVHDSNCDSKGLICGLALNAKSDQQYTQVCGKQIGWWSADQICGSSINNVAPLVPFGAPLNCADTFKNSDGSTSTYTNLHICTEPKGATNPEQAQSCYHDGAISDCCGCATSKHALHADWPSVISPSFGGSDNGCYANNSKWVSVAQPWLVFLKKACPTAYVYPFDDATSTFTCQKGAGEQSAPTYEVTFFDTK